MPFKLTQYLMQYSLIGILLSATAVLGFSYFLSLPSLQGDLFTRLTLATQQLMQISHLIMPLVILIGLAYGLGMLHNHSEMVQVVQQFSSLLSMGMIIFSFLVFTVLAELLIWPSLEAKTTNNSSWLKIDNLYTNQQDIIITTENNIIIGYQDNTHRLGNTSETDALLKPHNSTTLSPNSAWYPKNKKQQYQLWKAFHQSVWPLPLFLFLWRKISTINRGSNATAIAGSVAMHAIALGLLAEATHIVLVKALIEPWLTGTIPIAIISVTVIQRLRNT